jgi:hypothetical protein
MTTNAILRLILLIWVIGYLVLSCGGLFSGSLGSAALGLFGGLILLVPWILGIVILVVLVWLTNPRGPAGPR